MLNSTDSGTAGERGANGRSGRTVCLVPAAETEFSRRGRLQGNLDLPLTDHGRAAAGRVAEEWLSGDRLADGLFTVFSAADQSSRETAEILARRAGGKVRVLPELRGVSLGLWEEQLESDVRYRHPRIYDRWQRDPLSITPPEGEEMTDAWTRAAKAARRIEKKRRAGPVAVVAPGTVIGLLYCRLTDRPPDRVFEVEEAIGAMERVPTGATFRAG